MEAHLNDIKKLRVTSCCIEGSRVADPESWYLQYAGLIWRGKKIIYVSAVSTDPPVFKVIDGRTGATIADWKTMAVDVCDGGNTWGVVYDVETRKFSDLAVNGVA